MFFQAEDGIRDQWVTGVKTCGLPICEDNRIADSSVGSSLLCDKKVSNHSLSGSLDLLRAVHQLDSALVTSLEGSLATTTGENLGLHHKVSGADVLSNLLGLG